jgi:hypothetical protein
MQYYTMSQVFSGCGPCGMTPEDSPGHAGGLPDGLWKWVDEWHVNPVAGGDVISLDPDGWVYAFNWPADKRYFSPSMGANHFVRRRRWQRTRSLKSAAEVADILFEHSYSEAVILAAFKKNLTSSGAINLPEVVRTIKTISVQVERKNKQLESSGIDQGENADGYVAAGAEGVLTEPERDRLLRDLSTSCVSEALGLLAFVYVITADARVTSFFSIVREAVTANTPLWAMGTSKDLNFQSDVLSLTHRGQQLVDRLFTGKLATLDCGRLSGGNFAERIFRFVMSNDHAVCHKALDVLREHFQQVRIFSDQLSGVIYCSGSALYFKYMSLRSLVSNTKPYLDMYWIREDVCSSTAQLVKLFNEMTETLQGEGGTSVCDGMQDVARSLRAHELALKTLRCDIDGYKTMSVQQQKSSIPLWKAICLFLIAFLRDHDDNIRLVALAFGGEKFGIGIGFSGADSVVMLFSEMLSTEKKTLDHFPVQQLYSSVYEELSCRLYDIPAMYIYTDLLKHTLLHNDQSYEASNQNSLMRTMLSKQNLSLSLLYAEGGEGPSRLSVSYRHTRSQTEAGVGGNNAMADVVEEEGYKERKDLMRQYCELPLSSRNRSSSCSVYCTKLVFYHAACIELLALCAASGNVGNAVKSAQLLSIETVLAVLLEAETYPCYPILGAFSTFLVNVYLPVAAVEPGGAGAGAGAPQDESVLENPFLAQVIVRFCKVISAVGLEPASQWDLWPAGEGLRAFVVDGALPLFRAYFLAASLTQADGGEDQGQALPSASLPTLVQGALEHLQSLPRETFVASERSKIDDLAHNVFGMPEPPDSQRDRIESIDAAGKEHSKFSMDNPLNSMIGGLFKDTTSTKKKPTAEAVSWGDSAIRFSELPVLIDSCRYMKQLRHAELDSLVDCMMKGYRGRGDSEGTGGGGGGGGGSVISSEPGRGGGLKRDASVRSATAPLSSSAKTKSVASGTKDPTAKANTIAARANFTAMVTRLIKFAREEVDVLVSTDVSRGRSSVKVSLDSVKRASSTHHGGGSGGGDGMNLNFNLGLGNFDLTGNAGDPEDACMCNLLPDGPVVSRNIPFVFTVLAQCMARLVEDEQVEREDAKNNGNSFAPNSSAAIELADMQDIYADAFAPSLVAEVIAGCRYVSVLSAAVDLGVELLANGNKRCQDYFLWHLRVIDPSEASNFFSTFRSMMMLTAVAYSGLRREREEQLSGPGLPGAAAGSGPAGGPLGEAGERAEKAAALRAIGASKELLGRFCCGRMFELLRLLNENHNLEVQSVMENQKVT